MPSSLAGSRLQIPRLTECSQGLISRQAGFYMVIPNLLEDALYGSLHLRAVHEAGGRWKVFVQIVFRSML